jgi:hypothetical protein
MTTIFFGRRWDAPLLDGDSAVQMPTPTGDRCYVCGEWIAEGDRGLIRTITERRTLTDELVSHPAAVHAECEMLGVIGHVYSVCDCTGFDTSSRSAALELLARINAARASGGMGPL